jgi:hypothetical protein
MARYRYYGFQRSQLHRLHYTITHLEDWEPAARVFEVEARCVLSHLLVRTQHVIKIDHSSPYASALTICFLSSPFCLHLRSFWFTQCLLFQPQIRRISECPDDHTLPEDCAKCGFQSSCPDCPTELSFQKSQTGLDQYVAIITNWKDLGTVSAPEDRTWRAHTESHLMPPYAPEEFKSWGWTNPRWQLANIRERFETQPGIPVAELTSSNLQRWSSRKRSKHQARSYRLGSAWVK